MSLDFGDIVYFKWRIIETGAGSFSMVYTVHLSGNISRFIAMIRSQFSFLSLLLILLALIVSCQPEENRWLLSPEKGVPARESGWLTEYWSKQEHYADTVLADHNTQVLVIKADSFSFNRWYKKVNIKPYARYRISGLIKTENVQGKTNEAGAGFRLGNIPFNGNSLLKGSNDWTYMEFEFDSEGDDSFMLECLLGKKGEAKGTVWFDQLKLEELSARALNPEITLDLNQQSEPMSPYLYGQFIEHMGRSIYGGIWAEVLLDRKFYYVPGDDGSPWEISVPVSALSLDKSHQFSQGDIPIVKTTEGFSLSQDSLTLQAGKSYTGRIVFKASSGIRTLKGTISVNQEDVEFLDQSLSAAGFQTVTFSFSPNEDTRMATLSFRFEGTGEVTLAAVSLMPADNIQGFRPDVLALLKELNSPVYRWPGGNFVSGYDWKDGIGDPDKRPTRFDKAWNGLEYNDVGIDEFMELCRLLNAEANIAVNTGLGTAQMAAREVEYVNGSTATPMGKWRAQNGHPDPYGVRLWAVGNEMFGNWQLGHMPVEDYVKKHNSVADAMKVADPSIELIAVGLPGAWNDMMYTHSSDHMDYISEHFYRQDWHAGGLLTHVKQIPDVIREIAEEHRENRREHQELEGKDIRIALDEWNFWYGPHVYGLLGTRYFLRDALGIAAGFNELARQSDIYYMANYAQTVNVIGAIKTTATASWLEGTGLILKLYRQEFGTIPVSVTGAPEPLEIAATLTDDKEYLTISIVNATHQEYELNISGLVSSIEEEGQRFLISGENDMVYNDETNKDRISIKESEINLTGGSLIIPKESAGIYKFPLNCSN